MPRGDSVCWQYAASSCTAIFLVLSLMLSLSSQVKDTSAADAMIECEWYNPWLRYDPGVVDDDYIDKIKTAAFRKAGRTHAARRDSLCCVNFKLNTKSRKVYKPHQQALIGACRIPLQTAPAGGFDGDSSSEMDAEGGSAASGDDEC